MKSFNLRNPKLGFDVVILGGGPSGTAAGMTLLKHSDFSVAVLEKSDYTSPRIGESLTPGVRPLLEYLDLWEPFQKEPTLDLFGSQAAWGAETSNALDYLFTLHGSGWGLDRARFDHMLARMFEERGGTLFTQTSLLSCIRKQDEDWTLHIQNMEGGATQKIRCSYLIDATGRKSLFSKQMGVSRTVHDRLVGVGGVARLPKGTAMESVVLVEACEYGWWYTAPVPGNQISVVLMSDADIVNRKQATHRDRWLALLNEMKLSSQRIQGVEFAEEPQAFSAFSSCLQRVGGDNWVAVGDALSSHDPLSSSGIPHALGSGIHGGLVAFNTLKEKDDSLARFQQQVHHEFFNYLNTRWQFYCQETRWRDALFWKRRTTPILIDPHATIESVEVDAPLSDYDSSYLPNRLSQQLYEHCQPGYSAHEVVRSLTKTHPHIPDQQIILGFQELIQSGQVKLQYSSPGQ